MTDICLRCRRAEPLPIERCSPEIKGLCVDCAFEKVRDERLRELKKDVRHD